MIRYALRCAEGHSFDSWFASGAEYDRLSGAALLACAVCGDPRVEKDLMAPRLGGGPAEDGLLAPASPAEAARRALRRRIEATCEDVGRDFPAEARRIHAGQAPARGIIGEAAPHEARALIEEGVPIAPLPWGPARRAN
jgi:hypothetical protein